MVSGSYTGGLSFFKGLGEGKYAEAKKITKQDGTPISKGYAQSPCLGDWDGDGDWDLVLGEIMGPVKLHLNNGDFTFKKAGTLTCKGKPIEANDGGPCVVDWDGDGILDLVLGDDSGNVQFYKGATKGSLDLVADENAMVLPMSKPGESWQPRTPDPKSPTGFSPARPGARTKPFAADWNGDGKLDLLVGDYLQIAKPAPKLTAAQQKELTTLQKQRDTLMKKLNEGSKKAQEAGFKAIGKKQYTGMTKEESQKYSKAYSEVIEKDKAYQEAMMEYSSLWSRIEKLSPRAEGTGFVWVYLRK